MRPDAIEELYRRYYQDIYLYALSLCKSHHQAEDIASDTFYRAFLVPGKQDAPVRYWLLRICKNLCMDHFRRAKKAAHLPDTAAEAADPAPLDAIIQNERKRALFRALQELPAEQCEILYMFYFQGLPVAQVARLTGRTPGSVKTALCRCRGKLKEALKEEE